MSTPSSSRQHPVTLHLSRTVVWGLGILLVLPWIVLYVGQQSAEPPAPQPAAASVDPAEPGSPSATLYAQPGPWGELQYNRIMIEPPEATIAVTQPSSRPPVWTFVGYTPEKLAALWNTAGLDEAQKATLNDPKHQTAYAGGIQVSPPVAFVFALNTSARTTIYNALAEFSENPDHNDPFRFRADAAEEWFRHSGLKEETIKLVRGLLYRRGSSLLFSDHNIVLPRIPTLQERTLLIKTLARKSTLLVKLRIRANTDIDMLDTYWGRGQRAKDIKPLLQSLVREGNGTTIDIIHLLPRLPRSLLYTYPSPNEPGSRTYLDCHWTVLNFFNSRPDERFQEIEAVGDAFRNDYYPISGKPIFGDIIMFARPDGSIIHSCVFIADDIVYTKNGASPNAPWILMSLSDVVAFYPSNEPLDIQYYRAKSFDAGDQN